MLLRVTQEVKISRPLNDKVVIWGEIKTWLTTEKPAGLVQNQYGLVGNGSSESHTS